MSFDGVFSRLQSPGTHIAGAARRHWPIALILVLAIAVRALAWLAIWPAWWFIGDSIGYVGDTMPLRPDVWRPSGYGLLVLEPVKLVHSIAAVTLLQHAMGLAVGLLVYLTALRLGAPSWAAALAAIPTLLDGYVIATEQMLLSEPLFTVLVTGACALLLWARSRPPVALLAAAGLLLGLAAITRSIGIPLLAVVAVVLALRRPGWSGAAALCVACALPVAAYALWFDHWQGSLNLTASTGVFLYGRATQFVDCGRIPLADERLRAICPQEPVGQRNELFYEFDARSPIYTTTASLSSANEVAGRFALAAIRTQPGDYATLVWRDLIASFGPDAPWPAVLYEFTTNEQMPAYARSVGAAYERGGDPGPFYRPSAVHLLRSYQNVVRVPGEACLAALVIAALGLVLGGGPDRRGLRAAVVLTAGVSVILLVAPALWTSGDAARYRLPAIPLLSVAVVASALLLAGRASWLRSEFERRRRT